MLKLSTIISNAWYSKELESNKYNSNEPLQWKNKNETQLILNNNEGIKWEKKIQIILNFVII